MMKVLNAARAAILSGLLSVAAGSASAQDIYGGHFTQQSGEAVYRGICQGCHMPNAMGAVGAGAYPRLAGNPKLSEAGYPLYMVIYGRKAMPGFGGYLDDVQVANVVNYLRSHFGNRYTDKVTPADVARMRPAKTGNAKNSEHR